MVTTNCQVLKYNCWVVNTLTQVTPAQLGNCAKQDFIVIETYLCTDDQYIATPSAIATTSSSVSFTPETTTAIGQSLFIFFTFFLFIMFYMFYQIAKDIYKR